LARKKKLASSSAMPLTAAIANALISSSREIF